MLIFNQTQSEHKNYKPLKIKVKTSTLLYKTRHCMIHFFFQDHNFFNELMIILIQIQSYLD